MFDRRKPGGKGGGGRVAVSRNGRSHVYERGEGKGAVEGSLESAVGRGGERSSCK